MLSKLFNSRNTLSQSWVSKCKPYWRLIRNSLWLYVIDCYRSLERAMRSQEDPSQQKRDVAPPEQSTIGRILAVPCSKTLCRISKNVACGRCMKVRRNRGAQWWGTCEGHVWGAIEGHGWLFSRNLQIFSAKVHNTGLTSANLTLYARAPYQAW